MRKTAKDEQRRRDALVEEPAETDADKLLPVTPEDELVGDVALDGALAVADGLAGHAEAPKEDEGRRDDANAEDETPDETKVVLAADPEKDEGNEAAHASARRMTNERAFRKLDLAG